MTESDSWAADTRAIRAVRPGPAARWEDRHLAGAWRGFLADPAAYFRHLLAE